MTNKVHLIHCHGILPADFVPPGESPAYEGPGDIQSGALGWYGLRAYNAAYATGSNPAIDIVKASDGSAEQTINILADGTLDVATIAGLGYAVKVKKIYDQTTNANHMTQATLALMPGLSLNVINGKPAMVFTVAANEFLQCSSFSGNGQALPVSFSFVARRTASFTTSNSIIQAGNIVAGFGSFRNVADAASLEAEAEGFTATANDSVFHAVQAMDNNATSSLYVDGSLTNSGVSIGTATPTATLSICRDNRPLDGNICEAGIWAGDKTANNATMNSNQRSYWGF